MSSTRTQKRGFRRSVQLFSAFLQEQSHPEVFYGTLAEDSLQLVAEYVSLKKAVVLDVGAGPAEFAAVFRQAGARYIPLDHDFSVPSVHNHGVVAAAEALPFADNSVDVLFSSNLWEHVQYPERVADDMLRVLKPGGLLFLSYTNWHSPWGGHETSPWHWLGGDFAARRYTRKMGHPPKNLLGYTLFRVTVRQGMQWARTHPLLELVDMRPRYWPDSGRHLLSVPGLREIVSWNLLILGRKKPFGEGLEP